MTRLQVPAVRLLVLLSLAGVAASQDVPFHVSVNADLVVLHATVRDRKGQFAAGLSEKDFQIYEDGVRQSIRLFRHEDIPVTAGLVIDHSGSMAPKLNEVIAAARAFVRGSNQEDQLFVVNFNEHVTPGLSGAAGFTNRVDELERAIMHTPTTGETALYDAILEAQQELQGGTRDKRVLVVISDGRDNASKHTLDEVLKAIGRSNALVYTIGIFDEEDPEGSPGVLKRLAQATGGEAFISSRNLEVVTACERIARDIREQYTIGFIPTSGARPGAYRSIRVTAAGPGGAKLAVRTRAGYIEGGAAQ